MNRLEIEIKIINFLKRAPGSSGPQIAEGIGMPTKLYSLHPIFKYLKEVGEMHSTGNTNRTRFYAGQKP